ncbi:DNAJ homolog subfamily C member 18 isoform X2, putative [Babesia ovis]|uniref:DNAJ homolog subfamily C member 18 isoform X2, putative n=1 Tax=Babesia ovis TaxID=5869 RepID=A0A9W5T9H4_BABOV|nr:DNAJ homolog subfamily C member 18 isoform X2, putative [Babesia ovis]
MSEISSLVIALLSNRLFKDDWKLVLETVRLTCLDATDLALSGAVHEPAGLLSLPSTGFTVFGESASLHLTYSLSFIEKFLDKTFRADLLSDLAEQICFSCAAFAPCLFRCMTVWPLTSFWQL